MITALELCESRGGRPGLHVPYSPYGLCGPETTLNSKLVSSWCFEPSQPHKVIYIRAN